jgi:hypothetical protein
MLNNAVINYQKYDTNYDGTLFARRYLLTMFLKELKRRNHNSINEHEPIHEYNFLLSYLIVIDEIKEVDEALIEIAKKYDFKVMPSMPLLWASHINQYEFNDWINPAFELFKLLSFCKYAYHNYKGHLKELINKYNFKNISELIGSFHQIVKASMHNEPEELLQRLYFIVPNEGLGNNHLDSLCINNICDKEQLSISDLRKFPLFKTEKRGFMVIDETMYMKKIYRGPLFELHKETSLAEIIDFADYKNNVSKKCFEEILFNGIVSQLVQSEDSCVHFDNNDEVGEPDLYYRFKNEIFLVEFKDYLFPDSVLETKNFGNFKKYIEEKFLKSQNKNKGIAQIINCIESLIKNKYEFDSELSMKIRNGELLKIYPIICHTDFMFSMPGINEYLNCLFGENLKTKKLNHRGIHNITLVNLEVLYDLALRGKDFFTLLAFIKRYYQFVNLMRERSRISKSLEDFAPSTASFDEFYKTKFRNELIDKGELTDEERTSAMWDIIGITQEQIDEIL